MRDNTKAFCRLVAETLDCPGPVYEFGAYQVEGQTGYADLRRYFPGKPYVGCDVRPGPGVDRVEDVSAISLPDESVGTILCIETFEHVFEVRRAFDEVHRVLRPGGVFLITLPLNFRIHAFPEDYWRITPTCLKRLMEPYEARLTGFQGFAKFPHTVLGLGVKSPAPADVEAKLAGIKHAFERWARDEERALPMAERARRFVGGLYRSKGERNRIACYFHAELDIDRSIPAAVTTPPRPRVEPARTRPIPRPRRSQESPMTGRDQRLLILGLDGATWTVLDPMRRLGHMPNLDALLARSAHGTLRSTIPPVTSAAWSTMMTGCGPARHGVFDHRYFDIGAGRLKVNHSGRLRVPTFWHLLSQSGRSVASINLPVTYPPLDVRGVIVSGMDAPHLDAALSGSSEFAARLRAEIPDYHLRTLWKRPPRDLAEIRENADQTIKLFQARAKAGLLADEMVPDWSALMVQFQNLDPFQHRAWRYLNVDETGIDDPTFNAAAHDVMRGLDRAIGTLCELAEKRGAGVMVVSDHGFGPCLGRIHANRILIDAGVARLPGAFGHLKRRVSQVVEHARLWHEKRNDPEARSATFEQSMSAQFPFDWGKTLAFAPHQDTAAMVYLNAITRRAGAPLRTSSQIDDALRSASQALAEARHPETGDLLFPQVVDTATTYGIDPAREGYPDLIAMPDESYWVRTKLAPGTAWVEADPNLPGTHRPEGVVALCGAGILPGRNLRAQLRDVTPTILTWFGLPIPGHVEGEPLPCLAGSAWVGETERNDAAHTGYRGPHQPASDFEYTPEEQAIIEQRLADLGYLE